MIFITQKLGTTTKNGLQIRNQYRKYTDKRNTKSFFGKLLNRSITKTLISIYL